MGKKVLLGMLGLLIVNSIIWYAIGYSGGVAHPLAPPVQVNQDFTGQQVFDAVNAYRKSKDIPEVALNSILCNDLVSRWEDLRDPDTKGHGALQAWFDKYLPAGGTGGEIYATGPTVDSLIDFWKNSPGHRLMLENPDFLYGCAYASDNTGIFMFGRF